MTHRLLYGLEYVRTETEQIRDGRSIDLDTGEVSNVVGPDAFPVRDFPNSETAEYGFFVQDEIVFGDSGVRLVPAIRYDRYELDPKPDSIFIDDNPGITPTSLDEDAVSPKLALLWDVGMTTQLYAQYAEGFRAPPYNDVNVGFTNFQFGYTAIPNPDLKSETSQGVELGIRVRNGSLDLNAAVYRNDYEDFIESFQVVDFDPINNLLIFQSINLTEVQIEGAELGGRWTPAFFPNGLSLRFAAAWADGENSMTNQPLNSVEPFNAVVGLDYTDPAERWGVSFVGRGASRRDDLDNSGGDIFVAPGYAVVDAFGFWRPVDDLRLRLGVFNLFDREYFEQASFTNVPANSGAINRLKAPGTNVSFSIDYSW